MLIPQNIRKRKRSKTGYLYPVKYPRYTLAEIVDSQHSKPVSYGAKEWAAGKSFLPQKDSTNMARGRNMSISPPRTPRKTPYKATYVKLPVGPKGFALRKSSLVKKMMLKKYRKPTRGGGSTGPVSGGYMRSGRNAGNAFNKYASKGTIETMEAGITVTQLNINNSFPVAIGHSTLSPTNFYFLLGRSILKDMLKKAGIPMPELDDPFPFPVGTTIFITFQYDPLAGDTTATAFTSIGGSSFGDAANGIINQLVSIVAGQAEGNSLILKSANITTGTGPSSGYAASILLDTATVHYHSKSSLKVQNRTLALGADDDNNSTENVANQPLYGKSFDCPGGGLVFKQCGNGGVNYALLPQEAGLIGEAMVQGHCQEVPIPSMFVRVNKSAKVRLEPGQLKTSVLTHTVTMNLNKFIQQIVYGTGKRLQQLGTVAKTRVIMLEKMITATAGDLPPSIAGEVNLRHGLFLTYRTSYTTQEVRAATVYLAKT